MNIVAKIKEIVRSGKYYVIVVQKSKKFGKKAYKLTIPFFSKNEKHIQGFNIGDKVSIDFFINCHANIVKGVTYYDTKVYIDKIEKYKKKERFVPKENPVQVDGFKENYFEN